MEPRLLRSDENPSSIARQGYNASAEQYLQWQSTIQSPRLEWLDEAFKLLSEPATSSEDQPVHVHRRILELGCGAGVPISVKVAQTLQEKTTTTAAVAGVGVGHLVACDISSAQIELAQKHLADVGIRSSIGVVTTTRESEKGSSFPSIDSGGKGDGDEEGVVKVSLLESDMLSLNFSTDDEQQRFDIVIAFYSIIHLGQDDQKQMIARVFEWLKDGGIFVFNVTAKENQGFVMNDWLGMSAFWAGLGPDTTEHWLKGVGFELIKGQSLESEKDAAFHWIIAKKRN